MPPMNSNSRPRARTSASISEKWRWTIGSRIAKAISTRQKQSAQGGISVETHLAAI
jgi:hypothetical protein